MKTDRLFQVLYELADFPDSLRAGTARGRAYRERVDERVVCDTLPNDQILLTGGQREETMYFLDADLHVVFRVTEKSGKYTGFSRNSVV